MNLELPEVLKKPLRPVKHTLALYTAYDADYRRWYRQNFQKLTQFRDRHRGESCFIIGNGPSLNKMDLAPLRERYTFGLNKIYLMFDKVDLNLSYLVAVNPHVIEQSVQPFREIDCPVFLSWEYGGNYFPHCEHINFIRIAGWPVAFSRDITKQMWTGGTVTYVAMQIAYYMGFSTVYLIGVDHSFQIEGEPNEQQVLRGEDLNHFDPNYFGGGQKWHLPDLEGSELAYTIAKFVYERGERKILDATIDGRLTIFDKISYNDALQQSTRRSVS